MHPTLTQQNQINVHPQYIEPPQYLSSVSPNQLYIHSQSILPPLATQSQIKKVDHLFYNTVLYLHKTYRQQIYKLTDMIFTLCGVLLIDSYLFKTNENLPIDQNYSRGFLVICTIIMSYMLSVGLKNVYLCWHFKNIDLLLKVAKELNHQTHEYITHDAINNNLNAQIDLSTYKSTQIYNQSTNTPLTLQLSSIPFQMDVNIPPLSQQITTKIQKSFKIQKVSQFILETIYSLVFINVLITGLFYPTNILEWGLIVWYVYYMQAKKLLIVVVICVGLIVGILILVYLAIGYLLGCLFPKKFPQWKKKQPLVLPNAIKITQDLISEDDKSCSICFQDFVVGSQVIRLKCSPKHMYHTLCIKGWIKVKQTCPLCRAKIESQIREQGSG